MDSTRQVLRNAKRVLIETSVPSVPTPIEDCPGANVDIHDHKDEEEGDEDDTEDIADDDVDEDDLIDESPDDSEGHDEDFVIDMGALSQRYGSFEQMDDDDDTGVVGVVEAAVGQHGVLSLNRVYRSRREMSQDEKKKLIFGSDQIKP